MRQGIAGLLGGVVFGGLLLAASGPAVAATAGSADFFYDDYGNPADGVDGPGGFFDGVDTSGLWGRMDLEIVNQTVGDATDQIQIGYNAFDPSGSGGPVGYDVTSVAFLFDSANASLVSSLLTNVVNSTTEGLLSFDWEIVFINDGSLSGDGLPQPTNGVGTASMDALIVDLTLAETCGGGVIKTCGSTFGAGDSDVFTLQFLDGSLAGLMIADIFDFAYIRLQSVTPDSINGGSLFLGGEVQPVPLPAPIALLGSGLIFLYGFAGRRRRSAVA